MENTELKRKKVFVLAGLPGSGKSTWIRKAMNPDDDVHISRDEIRFSLLKDGDAYFEVEDKVRKFFFQQVEKYTVGNDTCENVYIDATHLNPKSRSQVIGHIDDTAHLIAVCFEMPISIALERNSQRSGRALVPETVIYNMAARYIVPTLKEGFDEVWHVDAEGNVRKETKTYG